MTYLTNSLAVISDTIKRHWETSDLDEQGYLIQDGTQRTLCEGQLESGEWVVFADTNGDPVGLFEDADAARDFIALLTSSNSDDTRESVIKAILDTIEDSDLRDWTADTLNSAA